MVNDLVFVQDVLQECGLRTRSNRLWDRVWVYRGSTLVFDFQIYGHPCGLDVVSKNGSLDISVLGRTDDARRILRNALIGKYPMVKRQGERHLLVPTKELKDPMAVLDFVERQVDDVITRGRKSVESMARNGDIPNDCLNVLWWDKRANFGDAVGPWLVERFTGKQPINGRERMLTTAPIATVGSIINIIDQDGTKIWGTGLMGPLSAAAAKRLQGMSDVSVSAVRGKRTRAELIKSLGWDIPEVYGDPALLLPRFLPRSGNQLTKGRVAVVPHYLHSKLFANVGNPKVHIVDVEQGMERVVQEIAAADACVSTSLHGVIVAQAYGVPWTWLRVSDYRLGGDRFKFEDFFSTLDEAAVQAMSVTSDQISDLDFDRVAHESRLPALKISLDALMASFPADVKIPSADQGEVSRGIDPSESIVVAASDDQDMREMLTYVLDELSSQRQLLEFLASSEGFSDSSDRQTPGSGPSTTQVA